MENKTIAPLIEPLKVPENLKLDAPLTLLAQTSKSLTEVFELWTLEYKKVYPNYKVNREDPFNAQSHIVCTKNSQNELVSTARLTVDSALGLPDDDIFPKEINMYRELGMKLLEFGRFISTEGSQKLLKSYYKAVYQIAQAENVDVIVMTMKDKDVALHRNLMGAYMLSPEMNTTNGSQYKMACMSWELDKTKERFFNWVGLSQEQKEGA